jgi:hypothetical protein
MRGRRRMMSDGTMGLIELVEKAGEAALTLPNDP